MKFTTKLYLVPITSFCLFIFGGCSFEEKKSMRDGSLPKSGDVRPGDGHDRGKLPSNDDLTDADKSYLKSLLAMEPLKDGHWMSDLIKSQRPMRPGADLGAWEYFGFAWQNTTNELHVTNAEQQTLQFSGPDETPLECRVDNTPWQSCTGNISISGLADGFHEAQVRSQASHILVGVYRWKIDRTPPKVFLARDLATGKYLLRGNETLKIAKCTVSEASHDCLSPFGENLAPGTAVKVTASDLAGNSFDTELKI